eukprot:TRINITY_DN1857_c0_g1_i1.p1 TRINITY_DN1857_c0_g1~~TRINITY_DN1857_c0_g1_i1.p1  ORF type:complete len:642 (+),score=204.16 TRINITY_DN1857_c0_g1_i1:326-2251(+)
MVKVLTVINEKNHGALLTGITLIIELCELHPEFVTSIKKLNPVLVKMLKCLVQSGYAPEYDVNGVTDPFLQVKILRLLRYIGTKDAVAAEEMNEILAQVATNTESARNVGNAILYECVQTIMGIDCEPGLRVLAVNILGRFLMNKDNNIRYVALNTLHKVVEADIQAVQRHRNTIVDCLKDPDISIRRRALDLIYTLVNDSNVRVLVRELLNFLVIADVHFRADIVAKLCWVTEKYAPSKRWHFDTILRVISIAGSFVPEEVLANLVTAIAQTPDLQGYAVRRLYAALCRDMSQATLQQVALWAIGEYGELLVGGAVHFEAEEEPIQPVAPEQVVEIVERLLQTPFVGLTVQQYALSAAIKLSTRLPTCALRLKAFVERYRTNIDVELQQRSCEYTNLFQWESVRAHVVDHIPPPEEKPDADADAKPRQQMVAPPPDVLSLLNTAMPAAASATITNTVAAAPIPAPAPTVISQLFGATPAAAAASLSTLVPLAPTRALPATASPEVVGAGVAGAAPAAVVTGGSSSFTVFQKNGLTCTFLVSHPPGQPHLYNVNVTYSNSSQDAFTDFSLKVAVPKWIKMQLNSASDCVVPPNNAGSVVQLVRLVNTQHGQSPVVLKLRFEFKSRDQPLMEQTDVTFPPGL